MNQQILTTDDIYSFFQVTHHVDYILKYYNEYKLYTENRLRNLKSNKYHVLITDKLFFDAITFHFRSISSPFRSFTEKMHQTIPTEGAFDLIFTLGIWNEVEDICEFDEQYDDEIFEALDKIKAYEKEIENYINSKEFLNYELTISEFLKWKEKDGILFVQTWLENIKKKSGITIQLEDITNESINKSWILYNEQNKYKKVSLKKGKPHTKFPLYLFLMSLEFMVAFKNKNLIKKLPFTKIPTKRINNNSTPRKSSNEELPFCTDYPYSIKTSKSIWTVRKK